MPYFSLEGCVCAGKSTVLKFIVPFLRKERRLCDVMSKPFSLFTDYQDQTYNSLTEMQHDAMRNIFPGQLHILKKSANYYSSRLDRDSDLTMISDRNIFSCYSFIDCYFREGYFYHFSKDYLINEWRDRCDRACKPDCFCHRLLMPAGFLDQEMPSSMSHKYLNVFHITVYCPCHT